jgi:L-fuculose-phosphate aldolase
MDDSPALRAKIIEACIWLQEHGFVIGTWGNVSVRIGQHAMVTPSRIDYLVMKPDDLVVIDLDGNVIEGSRSQLLGGGIPCTRRYVPAGHHLALGEETAKTIGKGNALLLRNHGPVCCGKDLEEALLVCQVVEKAARMFLALSTRARARAIKREFVDEEHHRFLYKYGKER